MRVAFVGKGGSGKTTLSSLYILYLKQQQLPILAIDADINQHLASSLNITHTANPIGADTKKIGNTLTRNNPRVQENTCIKTTPPGTGSELLQLNKPHEFWREYTSQHDSLQFIATGGFENADIGAKCFHSKTAAVELLLSHLIDTAQETVVVDMTAGADAFASGLFTKFDVTFLVCEPTMQSISVFKQYSSYAQDYGIDIRVIGNKIEERADRTFLEEHVGDALIASIGHSSFVKKKQKGLHKDISHLEHENLAVLQVMHSYASKKIRDWNTYYEHMLIFHTQNAHSWANAQLGVDVTSHIDPNFSLANVVSKLHRVTT